MSKITLFPALVCLIVFSSCSQSKTDPAEGKARDLFTRSLQLTNSYIDSISSAKDSTAVWRINAHFDEAMTELNYSYTPDIALKITEGENDTLVNLTDRYVAVRDSLLYRLAHPVVPPDSVVPDSI